MIPFAPDRAITSGDLLIIAAVACVVLALAAPGLRARSLRAETADAQRAVEELRSAAERRMIAQGSWPASAEPGSAPSELGGGFAADAQLSGDGWTVQWTRLEVVDSIPAPPVPTDLSGSDAPPEEQAATVRATVRTIGAVSVHSTDDRLLGTLLDLHGRDRSFVRDTTWTLVVPRRAEAR